MIQHTWLEPGLGLKTELHPTKLPVAKSVTDAESTDKLNRTTANQKNSKSYINMKNRFYCFHSVDNSNTNYVRWCL